MMIAVAAQAPHGESADASAGSDWSAKRICSAGGPTSISTHAQSTDGRLARDKIALFCCASFS